MMCAAGVPPTQKKIQGVTGGVLGGVGTTSFLSKDAFGHDDGTRAIVAGYFCCLRCVFYPGEHVTRDFGFVVVGASDAPMPLRR